MPRRPPLRLTWTRCLGAALLALAPLTPLTIAAPASAADPFYTGLLREGTLAYDRGAYGDAARDLRLACFGLLEEPVPLAGCLVRLALAQGAAGDAEGFQETFRRVVEVEERFGAYARAEVPPAVRAAFEERVAKAVPAATLATLPAFQRLAPKPEAPPAAGKPPRRESGRPDPRATAAKPALAPTPPPAPAAAPAGGPPAAGTAGAQAPVAAPPAAAPAPVVSTAPPAPVPRPLAAAERQALDEARRLLAQSDAQALRQALQLAGEVARAHPEDRAAQHLAAETAYRNARWEEAAGYFRQGGDPGDDKPELLFYLAVTLYEKGDPQSAATALRRALPNLERTPYVDSYARRILGS